MELQAAGVTDGSVTLVFVASAVTRYCIAVCVQAPVKTRLTEESKPEGRQAKDVLRESSECAHQPPRPRGLTSCAPAVTRATRARTIRHTAKVIRGGDDR